MWDLSPGSFENADVWFTLQIHQVKVFTDTDSLTHQIQMVNVYEDFYADK